MPSIFRNQEEMLQAAKTRFWQKVEKSDGCWMWTGDGAPPKGYGNIQYNKIHWKCHRFSWFIHFGEIPNNLQVLHTCDTPGCVRPDHLFLGTQLDNVADCVAKGRTLKGGDKPAAKFTENIARYILEHGVIGTRNNPGNAQELAEKFGVSARTVRAIIHRTSWKHLSATNT